jgi:lactoylglutathione lyase
MTMVELFVSDVDRSIAFYESLGLRLVKRWGDWARLVRGDSAIVLQGDAHAKAGPHYFTPNISRSPRGTGVEVVFEVDDVDGVYAGAQEQGVNVVKPIQDRDWKARDFRVADPDGYFIRFTTPLPSEHVF